ncbi:MAG TPA: GNAT family N-acetyltransferase [Cyclobacteriaceae bacterium]|nr:GNAT family N-acetyltransferase [Cyclobacteriaceae bacterium]
MRPRGIAAGFPILVPPTVIIVNTTKNDLPLIYDLFDQSAVYQEKHGYPSWRNYDRNAIVKDIDDGHQYKILIDGKVAIVFSVCYTDKIIWRHFDKGDSIYLHRIVGNTDFKGQRLFGVILDWAIDHCKQNGFNCIRMDTWAANPRIVEYYKGFGFNFIENFTTPDSDELPVHNRKLALTLLEYSIRQNRPVH